MPRQTSPLSQFVRSQRGISLVEILVVVGIVALMVLLAVPSLVAAQGSFIRSNAIGQLEFDLRRAREQAIERGALGILEISPDGASYSFTLDFLPRSSPPAADEVMFTSQLPQGVTIASAETLYLSSRGFVVDELEDPATISLNLSYGGETFCTTSVYATGRMVLESC